MKKETKKVEKTPPPTNPEQGKPIVPGITAASELKAPQADPESATQPDLLGQTNTNVVNPVAPQVEPQGVTEAVKREVAVPKARPEPAVGDDKYNKLLTAFNTLVDRGNEDMSFIAELKRQAGIL